jgi:hypothetical protein
MGSRGVRWVWSEGKQDSKLEGKSCLPEDNDKLSFLLWGLSQDQLTDVHDPHRIMQHRKLPLSQHTSTVRRLSGRSIVTFGFRKHTTSMHHRGYSLHVTPRRTTPSTRIHLPLAAQVAELCLKLLLAGEFVGLQEVQKHEQLSNVVLERGTCTRAGRRTRT